MDGYKKKIAIVSMEPLLTALRTLVQSAPILDLLVAEISLSAAAQKTQIKPDIVLIYLEQDHQPKRSEYAWSKKIDNLKNIWPGVYIIAIISDPKRRAEIQTSGADKVLFEGITPASLLASIETVQLQNHV